MLIEIHAFQDCRLTGVHGAGGCDDATVVRPLPIDAIMQVFMRALHRAGHEAEAPPQTPSMAEPRRKGCHSLEGRVWSFELQLRPSAMLEVDISLSMSDLSSHSVVWRADFPENGGSLLCVGPGCNLEDALSFALDEVEQLAATMFRSEAFSAAAGLAAAQEAILRARSRDTHFVVPADTWTSTDQGKIKMAGPSSDRGPDDQSASRQRRKVDSSPTGQTKADKQVAAELFD